MARRKKILLQTNAPWMRTGLSENGRILANWLARRDKYDLVYYCTQVADNDPNLGRMPYKCYGAIPSGEQHELQRLQAQDQGRLRDIMYGARFIEEIIRKEKPDVWIGSDDVWSFGAGYYRSEWFKRINSVMHITVDSVPVLEQAYEQAGATRHFLGWTEFVAKEMRKRGPEFAHVGHIYGASDTAKFRPVSREEKLALRRKHGIDPAATIFVYLGRNQLRKEFVSILEAFAAFKRDNPSANAKLLFHTSFAESGQGWDIPRLSRYLGVKDDDVLCTMFCRNCGSWEIRPYKGEDTDCHACKTHKSQCSANIVHGVPNEELYQVYGLADAAISAFTSGGLEFHNVNSLLCGLPLACTNYSCGEDFCAQPFVTPIKWHSRYEANTSFRKATNDVNSIRGFMERIHRMPEAERRAIGEQGRAWAAKEFHIDTIGAKWEALFDAMPEVNWDEVKLDYQPKNAAFPMPQFPATEDFVRALYKGVLLVDPDPKGLSDWTGWINDGKMSRDQVYAQFIQIAQSDNAKHAPTQDFGTQFDQTPRKRTLLVCKESGGDLAIITAIIPGIKAACPDSDLYVACDPKFNELLAGNEQIHRILPFHPAMNEELAMKQYVDNYYLPTVATQHKLAYLLRPAPTT